MVRNGIGIFRVSMTVIAVFVVFSVLAGHVFADSEAPKTPYARASKDGGVYAKCFPDDSSGEQGKTEVYRMGKEGEELLCSFDWFPGDIYLVDNFRNFGDFYAVVRIGHWSRGNEPNDQDLAIAFYRGCKEVRRYSTADIVRLGFVDPGNVKKSVSHYTVFQKIEGFKFLDFDKYEFDVVTEEGRRLSFDVTTGELRVNE